MVDTVIWRLKNWYINFPGGFLGGHRMIELGGGVILFTRKIAYFEMQVFFFFEISQGGPMGSMGWGRWAMADGPQGPRPRGPPRGGVYSSKFHPGPPNGPTGPHGALENGGERRRTEENGGERRNTQKP